MARRIDKAKVRYAENCISSGLMDGAAARQIKEHFNIALSTAYDYLNLAYQGLAETVSADTARKKGRIEAMLSQAAVRSLKQENIREFLKSTELLMRLQGLDHRSSEVTFAAGGVGELQRQIVAALQAAKPGDQPAPPDEDQQVDG